ncbi:MAG: hypothetical protein J6V07_06885, partial [Clostridia bacterium]|nr:hypothetical protein [Clostridia bacterium]
PESVYGEDDYNALYVQEGLVYAIDFFDTNMYWGENGEKTVTLTTVDEAKEAINSRVWHNTKNGDNYVTVDIGWGEENVEIAGGHFDTQKLTKLEFWYLAGLTNQSKAPNGATADMLMKVSEGAESTTPLVFNDIRPSLTYNGTKMKLESIGAYNSKTPSFKNIKYNGQDVTLKMYNVPTSLAMTTLVNTDYKGDFALYEDGSLIYENKGGMTYPKGSQYTKTAWRLDNTAGDLELKLDVYAARYYGRVLTADEIAQNHLADLAKWFRMDLGIVRMLNATSLAELYTFASDLTFDTENADEKLEAKAQELFEEQYSTTPEEYYKAAAAGKVEENFVKLAAENNLDLDRLLSIKEKDSIKVITDAILADFPIGYAVNEYVLRDELNKALAFLDSIEFIGTQVRIDDPSGARSYPGIRAIFRVGEEELIALLKENEDNEVKIGARVFGVENGEPATEVKEVPFYPELGPDGRLSFGKDSKIHWTADSEDASKDMLAFVYTVTYRKWEEDSFNGAISYKREYGYEFFVQIGDKTYTREVNYGQFGGSVSAADIYSYFWDRGEYQDNKVMQHVMEAIGKYTPPEDSTQN